MSKHTKGPWVVMPGKSAPRICIDGNLDWPIVVTISGHNDVGIAANERLIAAAPEMLEALKSVERDFIDRGQASAWDGLGTSAIRLVRAAIAKAEGKS